MNDFSIILHFFEHFFRESLFGKITMIFILVLFLDYLSISIISFSHTGKSPWALRLRIVTQGSRAILTPKLDLKPTLPNAHLFC